MEEVSLQDEPLEEIPLNDDEIDPTPKPKKKKKILKVPEQQI
jgi:hypothetical protein